MRVVSRGVRRSAVALGVAVSALGAQAASAQAAATPFGHACQPKAGVRFCPTANNEQRVASWDGTPLDVDVTLPASGDGPFPTIVMLHGLGMDKTGFQDTKPEGSHALAYHYNDVYYAQRGYAVVTPTARGFGGSCGAGTKNTAGCERGWGHLDDTRYEARDVQHLLGKLVDEGVADRRALGATGISYGAGTSAQLAFLKDRVRLPDGTYAAWKSPKGTPLSLAASYPRWGWADLATALVPNGRAHDGAPLSYAQATSPAGVPKLSYTTFLYLITGLLGNIAPAGADAESDLTGWYTQLLKGEPFSGPTVETMIRALREKGTTALPGTPAPMLVENGWNDALFTPQQALALYNQALAANPGSDVALQLADIGHMPASNRSDVAARLSDAGSAYLDAKLRGTGAAPAPRSVALHPMSCPAGAATPAPITAPTWAAAHPGTLSYTERLPQRVTSAGLGFFGQLAQDPVIPILAPTVGDVVKGLITGEQSLSSLTGILTGDASGFGPLFSQALQNSDPCRTSLALRDPNSITATGPLRTKPFTLVGMPRITADVRHAGPEGQLAARLWDIAPNGRQVLVSRGVYRLGANQSGTVSFQLDGNAYTFQRGHRPRVELLASDGPFLRPSNGLSTTLAKRVSVALPTAERTP